MLTFLRKIRKSLIDAGSARKYLLYAIGEIALVVIGILIALQINNWNEWKKDRIIERGLLIELLTSVKNNQDNLNAGLQSWKSTTRAIEIITSAMDNNLLDADSLTFHFREAHRTRGNNLNGLDFAGYKALENQGFDILTNKSLRKNVITLFEMYLPRLESSSDQVDFDNSSFQAEYLVRNFTVERFEEYPHDYSKIMKDRFYYSILRKLDDNLGRKIGRVRRTLLSIENVRELLEQELEEH